MASNKGAGFGAGGVSGHRCQWPVRSGQYSSHTAADGKSITQDCNACHELLATDEASPEILKTLGLEERISKVQKK